MCMGKTIKTPTKRIITINNNHNKVVYNDSKEGKYFMLDGTNYFFNQLSELSNTAEDMLIKDAGFTHKILETENSGLLVYKSNDNRIVKVHKYVSQTI